MMIGKTISHYKILEKLGGGGMGMVYRAQDLKLKRSVALKFLPPDLTRNPESKERFIQEAQAASALDHINICNIHEIDETQDGQLFIVLTYYEGETLKKKIKRGPLKLEEAIDIAIQVSRGLAKVHEMGIIHRDIKPANMMVTKDGVVKIVDFGLAKLVGGMHLDKAGTTMGTMAYMSPEQARGEEVDHRTDIWSLGVVLYEMLTGKLPFKSEYQQALVYSILNENPEPIASLRTGVPEELERVVSKTLSKSPDKRYQNINDVLFDLRKLRKEIESIVLKEQAVTTKVQPSIAVLPFTNLSADKEQEYFCDGMAENLINALAHVEDLRVVARTSAFSFRGKEIDIREIGRTLNVETLLEGSVRKAGSRVRITAQLVNVSDGYHLWSEKYDRDIGEMCCPEDIFTIQDEISLAIVDKLKVKLLGGEKAKLVKRHTKDIEAYALYLKGRFFWNKRTEEGYLKSLEYLLQAIDRDPDYALAYAGIADSYDLLGWYDYLPPEKAFPKAKTAAKRALEMDDALAQANASLGWISVNYDWDWSTGESKYKQAIELNPSYATVHQWYAEYLSYMGRHDESIAEAKRALELDPLSIIINTDLGQVLYYARQYDRAIEQLQKTLELDPDFVIAHFFLASLYVQQKMYDKAIAEVQKAMDLSRKDDSLIVAQLGTIYSYSGWKDEARKVLHKLRQLSKQKYVSPFYSALIYMGLGQKDQTFEWLERAYEKRDHWLETLKVHPMLDSLRSDPRFIALLKKMGLAK
jgi:serine/threonine protein kinase/tetratricopeptide (TPR) repeat protein